GWTVADLVEHLGAVQVFWTHTVQAGGDPPDQDAIRTEQKPTGDLITWAEQSAACLVKALRDTPSHAASWCWWNAERRAPVEEVAPGPGDGAVMHPWEREGATGHPRPGEAAVGSGGVDGVAPRILNGPDWSGPSGVVAMRADDVSQEWRFGVGSASPREGGKPAWLREYDRRKRQPGASVSGPAEQLDPLLWRRVEAGLGHVGGRLRPVR